MAISILKNNKTVNITGTYNESSSTVSFNKNGNINCDEIIEAPVFTSSAPYDAVNCNDYCTRNSPVSWSNSDIIESKGNWWTKGNIIFLIIPCTDGTYYVGYHRVESDTSLQPLNKFKIQSDNQQNMIIGKDKKIYFNEFIES